MATKEKIYTLLEILKLIEEAKRLGVDADGNALWGTPSEVYTQPLFLNRFTDDENTISSWHDITYPRNNLYYVKFKDMPKYLLDEYTNNQRHLYKDDKRINKDNIDPETWLVFDSSGHRITTEEDKYLREKYGEDYLDKYGKVIKDNPEWFFDYRDPRDIYAENNNLIPYKDGVIYNTFEQYNDQQENSEWEPWRPNLDTSDDSKENQQSIDNLFKPQRSLTLPITEGVEEGIQNIYPTHNGESKLVAGAGIIPNSYLPDLNFVQVPQTSYEDFDPSSIPTIFIPSQDKRFGLNFNLKDYDWSDLDEDEAIYLGRRKSNDFYKYLLPYLFSDLREKPFAKPKEDGIKIRMSADGGQLNLFEKGSKVRSKYKSDNDWELMYELSKPIYQQFIDAGIDPIIATGVLGNIALESSFNPKASNRTHWGYVLNDRSLTDYVTSNYGGYGPEQQIQYLIDGLTKGIKGSDKGKGKAILKRFTNFLNAAKGVTDPADIAKLWDDYYEISGGLALYDRRNYATKFWDKYNVPLTQETTYLESPLLLQYSQPELLQQNTTDVLINPLVKQPIYLTQQQPSTQQLAIMMAEPDLYTTELADVDLMKELFEPLGIKHTNKKEENPEEHNYKIKLSFDEGGILNLDKDAIMSDYDTWVNYLVLKKPYLRGEDFYNDNTYNYRAFFEESPEEAYKMLLDDEEAHFTDSYKTVNHPTFSTESNYSGYVNEYNPNGIEGGTWSETEPWTYTFSPSQIANNWNIPNTIDYVNDAENNGVTLYMPDGTLPKYAPIPFALDDNYFGGVLPNIIVENANGGPLNIYKGGTNNLKLSDSTRRLLLSLPSNPRSLLRTKIPVAQSDVTGRINIDKKQEQARRTNTKKVIGAAARRRAALDSYRYGDNNIGYRYRQAQAEKDPEGYMEQANAIDEARALELHTFINQETRTPLQIAVGHEKFLKNAEHEKRAEEKARADEHLGAFMNLFKILSPSYQLGAARGVYEGNNYIDALYGDLNAGLPTFLLGQYSGKGFEEQYPLTTFGINFATDWAATKGIGAISNAASKASNVSKLSNIAKVSRASEAGPKGLPLFGGRRFYTYKQFQNNPSWYYRVGKDLAKYAEDLGVITGKMSEAPFFSKGEALTSKGLNRDIIVHKGNGNYDWANLDVEGNVILNPRTWVDDMTGLTRMWNDVTNKPVGPTEVTPLVNGKAGVANPADFTVFRPFNIFGKNFGYIEKPLISNRNFLNMPNMLNTFGKLYNSVVGTFKPVYYNQYREMPIFKKGSILDNALSKYSHKYRNTVADMENEFYDMIKNTLNTVEKQTSRQLPGYMQKYNISDKTLLKVLSLILPRIKSYSQNDIDKIRKILEENRFVNIVSDDMMKVMQPNTRGFVLEDGTGPISLNNSFDLSTYGHELLHKFQLAGIPLTKTLQAALNRAYGKPFITMGDWKPTWKERIFNNYKLRFKNYPYLEKELQTTNFNARYKLLHDYKVNNFKSTDQLRNLTLKEQNDIIRNATNEQVLNSVYNSNGYGRQYVKRLNSIYNNKIPLNVIDNFKSSMMKVYLIEDDPAFIDILNNTIN